MAASRILITFISGLLLIPLLFPSGIVHATSAAGFKAGDIMDDTIMTKSDSMSVSQVQSFLSSKVPTCDTNGQQISEYGGPDLNGDGKVQRWEWGKAKYNQTKFICLKNYKNSSGVSAAQIILDKSKKYSINPQALIVLLQKEQGLVTDTWPLNIQYRTATGYGCPDTAPCDSQYYGLTNQLDWAAKMYHSIITQDPDWYSPYILGYNPVVYWHPDTSRCGSQSLTIRNWTTASLYSYTPYRPNQAALNAGYGTGNSCSSYGNRNFYLYFTDWFGSTTGSYFVKGSSAGVYLLDASANKKYLVPNSAILSSYSPKQKITSVSDDYLSSIPTNGTLSNSIKTDTTGSTVYLVDNGKRYGFSSGTVCTNWGVSCNTAVTISSSTADSFLPVSQTVRPLMSHNGTIYLMKDGKKSPFLSMKAISDQGYTLDATTIASEINASQPYGISYIHDGGLVKFASASTIFYYNKGSYYGIPSLEMLKAWFPKGSVVQDNYSSYTDTPPTSSGAVSRYLTVSARNYLVDNGTAYDLTNVSSDWPTPSTNTFMADQLSQLPHRTVSASDVFQSPDGAIFKVENSRKRPVVSWRDFLDLGYSPANVMSLKSVLPITIPVGPSLLANGRLIKTDNSSAFVLINSPTSSFYLTSMDDLATLNTSSSQIIKVNASTMQQYTQTSNPLGYAVVNAKGNRYLLAEGRKVSVSSSFNSDWGISTNSYVLLNDRSLDKIPTLAKNIRFLAHKGTIYYGSDGHRHPLSSYTTYLSMGGDSSNTLTVADKIISLSPAGSPL